MSFLLGFSFHSLVFPHWLIFLILPLTCRWFLESGLRSLCSVHYAVPSCGFFHLQSIITPKSFSNSDLSPDMETLILTCRRNILSWISPRLLQTWKVQLWACQNPPPTLSPFILLPKDRMFFLCLLCWVSPKQSSSCSARNLRVLVVAVSVYSLFPGPQPVLAYLPGKYLSSDSSRLGLLTYFR